MKKSNEEKRVIIYCRESRDDYGENYERIETQRDLLIKYCKNHGYTNIKEIIMDDDKSGTDFKRLDCIKEKASKNAIDTIIFKNSSRLGRNQKQALEFVEYMEEKGVEIIFEDEQFNDEMFGLYAWFNERRARDDSKNIRRNLRHKIEEGKLLIKAIYGYNKNENKLEINEKTAQIVKEIFDLYSKGWGYKKIASYLNEKKVQTPSQARGFVNAKKAGKWNNQHISRILEDRRYIGDYIGGHTEKINFKSKKTRVKEKDKWIIIEKHHEPIIDKELFETVQKIKKARKNKKYSSQTQNNIYSGLIYCGKCGSLMYKRKEAKRPDSYLCSKYSREGVIKGNFGCKSHRIRTDNLNKIINKYLEAYIENDNIKKFIIQNMNIINTEKIGIELKKEKQYLLKLETQYKQIYDDKLNEIIPEFLYHIKKEEIDKCMKKEEEKIEKLNDKLKQLDKLENKQEIISETIKQIRENGLDKEEINQIFSKIIIFESNEIRKQEKDLYNIDDMMYNELDKNGGIIFLTNFEVINNHNQGDVT